MKKFLGAFLLVASLNSVASACEQYEAQVVGKITSVRDIDGYDICDVKLEFTFYKEHIFCPIDKGVAERSTIRIFNCNQSKAAIGSTIGGILIDDNTGLHIDL